MTNSRKIGMVIGLCVALGTLGLIMWQGATLAGSSTAYAQGGPTATPAAPGNGPNRANGAGEMISAFWSALATRLGIGVDDLKSKVQSGALTQAQADQMLARLTLDQIDLSRPIGHPGPRGGTQ